MKVLFRKKFLKELALVPAKRRYQIEEFVFNELGSLTSLSETNKLEKMKGYKNYYKTRFGDYRVGMQVTDDSIIIERVLHRKEIYKFFP